MLRGRILLLFAALIIGILVPLNECKPQKNHPSPLFSGADVAVDPTHVAHHHSAVKREDAVAEGGETTVNPCQAAIAARLTDEEKAKLAKEAEDGALAALEAESKKIKDDATLAATKYKEQAMEDAKAAAQAEVDKIIKDANNEAAKIVGDAKSKAAEMLKSLTGL